MCMSKMKKLAGVCAAVAMMAVVMTGCGGSKTTSDTIKIGADLEMTGNNATFGKSANNAVALAIKQVNAKPELFM